MQYNNASHDIEYKPRISFPKTFMGIPWGQTIKETLLLAFGLIGVPYLFMWLVYLIYG